MKKITDYLVTALICLIVGLFVGYFIRKKIAEAKIDSAEEAAKKILAEAERNAEAKKKEAILEAKEENHKLRVELDREIRERRNEMQRLERRLLQKEETLDRKAEVIERKEEEARNLEQELEQQSKIVADLKQQQMDELVRISNLSFNQAREMLLKRVEEEIQLETAMLIKDYEEQAKEEGEKKAREIISLAIQRCAADHVAESTVSVVALPNDEMKGRIIGREGRNIRTLETLTGIDLIIDDTPEAVILSGFDPIRREVARIALEKLILDGRIHPARIEDMVEKAQKEIASKIKEEGEQATFETGVNGLHPELVKLLGRLQYRTSYGQNVLKHSIEVAHLAAVMAAELDVDVALAKRAGLLHDIGKAVDHEVEGPHVTIGANLAKKYRESEKVVHAIRAHHGDESFQSVEAVLVAAADAISAARPGARRETLEAYIQRLEKLEEIANTFEGVEKSYAIQAGREIRIIVRPEKINDENSITMARELVKSIEKNLDYPGQIKVVVIRETRAVDYAK